MIGRTPLFVSAILALGFVACAHAPKPTTAAPEITHVLIHPPFGEKYFCSEHTSEEFTEPGDALGSDCVVERFVEDRGRKWMRAYRGDGIRNEDWYTWNQDVLAPFDGKVLKVNPPPKNNEPGKHSGGRSGFVAIGRADGVIVMIGHLHGIRVKEGDSVRAGAPIAQAGNNGSSWHPHVHIGAWIDSRPLPIRFDLNVPLRTVTEALKN